ncbi:FAD-dependent oxidoreductase [bacterium]|nr:FAD-dependent oxidoreductase [bacterium]
MIEEKDGMKMLELAIIGGGPAGYTAAIYAKRGGVDFILFNDGIAGGQISTTSHLENYPGIPEPISGMEFSQRLVKHAENLGFEAEQSLIEKLEVDENGITLTDEDDEVYRVGMVILATGAVSRPLPIEGAASYVGRGLSYCATCDGNFYRNRDVVVVGGGDTGLEEALYLSRLCRKVYLIHRRHEFRAVKILQWRVAADPNIEVLLPNVPHRVIGESNVEGLEIKNVETGELRTLEVTGIFSALGVVPNSELVKGICDLNNGGYVITDQRMFTSNKRILAAGDVVASPLRQVSVGVGHGAIAAEQARLWIDEHCNIDALRKHKS